MRLLLSLGFLVALSTTALADSDPVACHVTLQSTTRRTEHHVTSCKTTDDTKYDEKLEENYHVRSGCTVRMDDGSITIDLDVPEPATGSMTMSQENAGVYGSKASGSTTISGKSRGSILLMKLPSGALLPQASLSFAAKSSGKTHMHDNCDPNKKDFDKADSSELDALITPFPEVFMHQKDPAAMMTAPPVFQISADAFEKGLKSHKSFNVAGTGSYKWHDEGVNADVETTVTMTVEIGPSDVKYEAYFIPSTGWETFVPEGPAPPKMSGNGNTVSLAVELHDKKTGDRSTKKFSVTYGLESSKLGGTCMNWPPVDQGGPEETDYIFDAKSNKDGKIGDSGRTLQLPMGKGDRQVTVTSRDFGGYARVFAHVTTEDGVTLDAVWTDGTNALSIPKDEDKNHVADIWEKEKNVYGKKALDDDEDFPDTLGSKGDGYTLFAEYRGFVQADGDNVLRPRGKLPKLAYTRFDPVRRDVFVGLSIDHAEDEAPIKASVNLFFQATGFVAHYLPRRTTTNRLDGDEPSFLRHTELRTDGHEEVYGKTPTVAIWVASDVSPGDNNSPAFAKSIHGDGRNVYSWEQDRATGVFHSPMDVPIVVVSRKNSIGSVLANADNIDPGTSGTPKFADALKFRSAAQLRTIAANARANPAPLAEKMMKFVLSHELGHAVGAYHHGNDPSSGSQTCPMWYWHFKVESLLKFLDGSWDPSVTTLSGVPYSFCDENKGQINLHP